MTGQLHFEQENSLVSRLQQAGIKHGDTAEVTLEGVGVRTREDGGVALAFCPSSVLKATIVRKGTFMERRQPIPPVVQVSNNLRNRIFENAPQHGFVRLALRVHSNGHIQLNGRVTKTERVPRSIHVHGTESHRDYKELCAGR